MSKRQDIARIEATLNTVYSALDAFEATWGDTPAPEGIAAAWNALHSAEAAASAELARLKAPVRRVSPETAALVAANID